MATTHRFKQDLSFQAELAGRSLTFTTTWGLFSPKSIDDGTGLLVSYLDILPTNDCLDLGCGYGPLGLVMANLAHKGTTHMVDKDFVAIDYAAENARINQITNTRTYLSNGFDQVPQEMLFDVIATNLPAKINGELVDIFLTDAYEHLKPGGKFYIVTISGLRDYIKRKLTDNFGNYKKLKTSGTYTAALAIKS